MRIESVGHGVQRRSPMRADKYSPYRPICLPDRTWPDRVQEAAPLWCSVDLRDGNQSLVAPMDAARKRRLFDCLVGLGFKEIEVGYPTASRDEYDFVRQLIEDDAIPDDVFVQVMAPIRDDFIARTVRALDGARRVILQVFNPTSEVQRRLVFRKSREEILALALDGAEQALRLQDSLSGEIYLQYAPESFTQTEPDFALDVCNAVLDYWAPRTDKRLRVNLPATVEVFPPSEFADRIEYMSRNLGHRDRTILSVHPHNDRGSGVASAELALLAGADRVEGTLFGSGERTGNVCLVTMAMNLYSQGVDPMLDLSDIDSIRRVVETCNQMPVSPRHPWAGDLVYTSFAGTHQDAIAKGLAARRESASESWDVPYLPIDPDDVGRDYQALIRINTQSGKGGMAHILRTEYGLELPRRLQIDFAAEMQRLCEEVGEVGPARLWAVFEEAYVLPGAADRQDIPVPPPGTGRDWTDRGRELLADEGIPGEVVTLETGSAARGGAGSVAAFCEIAVGPRRFWGVGIEEGAEAACRGAVVAAVRRAARAGAGRAVKEVSCS